MTSLSGRRVACLWLPAHLPHEMFSLGPGAHQAVAQHPVLRGCETHTLRIPWCVRKGCPHGTVEPADVSWQTWAALSPRGHERLSSLLLYYFSQESCCVVYAGHDFKGRVRTPSETWCSLLFYYVTQAVLGSLCLPQPLESWSHKQAPP